MKADYCNMLWECPLVFWLLFSGSNCEIIFNFFIMMQNHGVHITKILGCFSNCMYVLPFIFIVLQEEIHIPHSRLCVTASDSWNSKIIWHVKGLVVSSSGMQEWVMSSQEAIDTRDVGKTLASHPQEYIWFEHRLPSLYCGGLCPHLQRWSHGTWEAQLS